MSLPEYWVLPMHSDGLTLPVSPIWAARGR